MDPVEKGGALLAAGKLVCFPTETVYGIGADALNADAVREIYDAKGRPGDNPCIVHIADMQMLGRVAKTVPKEARPLMKKFWPGPLTLIFEKSSAVPDVVTGGLPTVAVRMPEHPVARRLIREASVPVAAPSANRSGRPSPTRAAHVRKDFPGLFVIDGGSAVHGVESTVVALNPPRILRVGAITLEQLKKVIPRIRLADDAKGESPGTRYRHYAPSKPLVLCASAAEAKKLFRPGDAVLCKDQHTKQFSNAVALGKTNAEMARNLYDALRTERGRRLLVVGVPKRGLGRTIMDRLERAAHHS